MDLRDALNRVAPYPFGIIPVPEPIKGNAFFPGGSGLWQGKLNELKPTLPIGGIMVLGHDFHSEEGYESSREHGFERLTDPTWRNMLALFREADIDPAHCFFTNFYMGLRAKGQGATGKFPGRKDHSFVSRCNAFFSEQLQYQQPKTIFVLGTQVPPLLAAICAQLLPWANAKSMNDIDKNNAGLQRNVLFPNGHVVNSVAVLTHPSQRRLNVHRRRHEDLRGHEAELQVIRDCVGRH